MWSCLNCARLSESPSEVTDCGGEAGSCAHAIVRGQARMARRSAVQVSERRFAAISMGRGLRENRKKYISGDERAVHVAKAIATRVTRQESRPFESRAAGFSG